MVTKETESSKSVTTRTTDYFCVYHTLSYDNIDDLIEHYQISHLMTEKQAKDFHSKYHFDVKRWETKNIGK